MMLPRKRQRPNPAEASSSSLPATALSQAASTNTSQASSASGSAAGHQLMPPPRNDTASLAPDDQKQVRKSRSWYGSWPRTPKATPSTSVARENIQGGTVKSNRTLDLGRFDLRKEGDASSVNSASGSATDRSKVSENAAGPTKATTEDNSHKAAGGSTDSPMPDATTKASEESEQAAQALSTPQRPSTSSGWLGWWSRTPFIESQASTAPAKKTSDTDKTDAPRPSTPPAQTEPTDQAPSQTAPNPASTSWFGFWSSNPGPATQSDKDKESKNPEPAKGAEDVTMKDAPPPGAKERQPPPSAGSTWAFWAKDSPKTKGKIVNPESGEIAVMGERSEAHPKPMVEGDVSGTPSKESKNDAKTQTRSTWRKNKRLRPPSMDTEPQSPSPASSTTPTTEQSPTPAVQEAAQPAVPKADQPSKAVAESETPTKGPPNLLLPSFSSTYQMKENPSILKQVAHFLLRTSQPPASHVFRVKDPPKIRKAIAIGVHGLFPATYLRPMIGQPTGTSLRFASLCAEAIRRWTDAHGCPDCEIEKVALEGEGRINERVDNLWKLMLNWIDQIRSADLIILASHSQGVPVSIMLLDKLIELGIITRAKVGVCAMAGVSLGPFPEYRSGILMGSAAELWDFGDPRSSNAQRFEASLKRVLEYGARITFIGSIDDQLVPMESAVYSPANHPFIYRAVFIDGRTHAPDFIAHLVGFALKLRNLGVSDHGLIRELSLPLAGSLYSGDGHSRLYYDAAVYDLAISHALETAAAPDAASSAAPPPPCVVRHRDTGAPGNAPQPNPYILPWIMRGMLEEDFVRTELSSETDELLRQFDDWKPTNKALKDVKYRLEAVRSKL